MLIRTVCRTTVGANAASAAVPNGQDDERHTSAEGPLGRLRALHYFLPGSSGHAETHGSPLRCRGETYPSTAATTPPPDTPSTSRSRDRDRDAGRIDRQPQHGEA